MNKWLGLLIVCVLAYGTVKPFFGTNYFPMHDDTQVARVVVMGRAISQGQFPVRWVSDLGYGYGYPIFNFYAPLPYYFGGMLYALGLDAVAATNNMFLLGGLLAAISAYALLVTVYGIFPAIVGAIVFSYAPYHAVQMFVRGSVGEYWAVGFLPLILVGFRQLGKKKLEVPGVIVSGFALFGVITSHTILGFIVTSMLILTGVSIFLFSHRVQNKPTDLLSSMVRSIVLGLGLSAFFWLPALVEMKYTSVASMVSLAPSRFADHFVCLRQLWDSSWGYGGSAPGCDRDGMSFKIGKLHLMVVGSVVGLWIFQIWKKKKMHDIYSPIAVVLFGVSVLGMLSVSGPFWSLVPFREFIQYPWRLLVFPMVAASICAAYLVSQVRRVFARLSIGIGIIVLCIFINMKLFQPNWLYTPRSGVFESEEDLRFRVSKISDEYLPDGIVKPSSASEIAGDVIPGSDTLTVRVTRETDTAYTAQLTSARDQTVVIQKAVFPGWIYKINGEFVTPHVSSGLPSVVVSKGESVLDMYLINSPIRNVGNIISIVSWIVMGGLIYYARKTKT